MIDQDMLLIILSHKQFLSYGTLTFHAVVTTLSYIMLSWRGQVTYRWDDYNICFVFRPTHWTEFL